MKRLLVFYLLFVLLTALPLSLGQLKEARMGNPVDMGVDSNGDGYYEVLKIEVPIDVYLEGTYRLVADLTPSSIDLYSYSNEIHLQVGGYKLSVNLPGEELYREKIDGSLKVHLSLFYEGSVADEINYTTAIYSFKQFAPGTSYPYSEAKVVVSAKSVTIFNDLTTVTVNGTHAQFSVSYTNSTKRTFNLLPAKIGIYQDNGNGYLDSTDPLLVSGSLRDTVWELNSRIGQCYEGSLTGIVPLLGPGNVQLALAQVSFYFNSMNLSKKGDHLPIKMVVSILGEINGDFITLSFNVNPPKGGEINKQVEGDITSFISVENGKNKEFLSINLKNVSYSNGTISMEKRWGPETSITLSLGVDPRNFPKERKEGKYLNNKVNTLVFGIIITALAVVATMGVQWTKTHRG